MKKILYLCILFLSLPVVVAAQNKNLKVFFTSKMTLQDLENRKKNLLEGYNIHLEYNAKFDERGHLQEITFSVDCRNNLKGSGGPFRVNNKKEYGFFRDFRKKARVPFGIIKRR